VRDSAHDLASRIESTAGGVGIFWFEYRAPPPEGRLLHVAAVTGVVDPCSLFQDQDTESEEIAASVVNVVLSDTDYGPHEVTATPDLSGDEASASVNWVEDPIKKNRIRAFGGSVDYVAGPDNETSWRGGANALVRVAVDFESDPIVVASCNGSTDSEVDSAVGCDCQRLSGADFWCAGADCCFNVEAGTASEHMEFEILANQCAAGCVYAEPELSEYCQQLE